MKKLTLLLASTFLLQCAGDIKGTDALTNPFVRIERPSFFSLTPTKIAIDASTLHPALFKFGSEILKAEETLLCDITKSGIGGVREGLTITPDTIYYLYGVKNGTSPGLIIDSNPPTTGPEEFSDWTYIGAFPVNTDLTDFDSSDGFLNTSALSTTVDISNAAPAQAYVLTLPTTAHKAYLRGLWVDVSVVGHDLTIGASDSLTNVQLQSTSTTAAANPVSFFWVALITPKTIFGKVTTATVDKATVAVFGWKENPEDYK